VITGFNTDIKHNDKVYHVQTEDKGVVLSLHRVSRVCRWRDSRVEKDSVCRAGEERGIDDKWIGGLMEQQHRTMIAAVKRGRFDQPAEITSSATPTPDL
jgi:hypothetical protein